MTSRNPPVVGAGGAPLSRTGAKGGEYVRSMTWEGGGFHVGRLVDIVGRTGSSSGTGCRDLADVTGTRGEGFTY